ncbi:MAG: hypothetical protein LUF04_06815 [Bacteroides sp.]|nr:hypothetical protein [Bacteroides sp.]
MEADKKLHKQRTEQSIAYQKQILSDDKLISFIEAQIKANDDLIESYHKVINDPEASIEAKIEATNRLMEAERESQALNEELLATEKQANEDRIQFEKELRKAQGFDGDLSQEELEELKKKETEEEIARLHDIAHNTTLSYEQRAKALTEYNKLRDEQRKQQQKEEEEEVERQEEFENEQLQLRSSFLSEASEMLGEHTVAGKAAAIAAATIDTYRAGTLALSSSPPPFNYIALATTIATGLATVKNILSTQVPNATDTTSAASASIPLPSMPENMGEIVETHNNMDSYDQEFLNSNRAVLVVENFNSVDSRINVAESKATY